MADEHHEDHGNTVAGWFLTLSWIVVWTAAGVAIMFDENVVMWSAVALGASVVCAAVAGIMKKAGLGRKHPRTAPPTREEWEALQAGRHKPEPEQAEAAQPSGGDEHADETAAAH
ncbi:hypothetical protein FZ103_06290 [Streptomonospora sp. PA3]|uniref:HGxxPAAW family protein n=1 Tax=Streptomonospora sp. PA3 TaxID=2607326 RepID=UPI0012DCF827|nr:HGxxPAAW family protein [Streptomonospora sp. PA3]MUL40793.1 hypothetical protein [Streptomonospora sp. PA3]